MEDVESLPQGTFGKRRATAIEEITTNCLRLGHLYYNIHIHIYSIHVIEYMCVCLYMHIYICIYYTGIYVYIHI
jgi:hypothetical protein